MTTGPRHTLQAPMSAHDVVEIPGLHRRDERPLSRGLVIAICALAALAVAAGGFLTLRTGEVEDQAEQLPVVAEQRDAAAGQAVDLGRRVTDACARGEVVQSEGGQDLCELAARVQSEPVPPVPAAPATGLPGRPPTPAEIDAAVAAYMLAHPPAAGRPPTPAEVAAAVAEYMTANPPQPGRPPTAEEIAAAVATYFANNPPPEGPRGPRGETGQPGPGPTAEEIDAAVAAYLAVNPPPQGPPGEPGPTCPEGSSLESVTFASGEAGLGCVTGEAPVTTAPTPTPTTTTSTTTMMEEPDNEGLLDD